MKKILLAATFLAAAAPAFAADLPSRIAAPAPAPMMAPIFTWTGFYVGVQGGYAWGTSKWLQTAGATRLGTATLKPKGALGGAHAGYNWQSGALVYGVEVDLEGAGVKDDDLFVRVSNSLRGSARLRLGFAADRALLYVTGGAAVAQWKRRALGATRVSATDTEIGWTVGLGMEYALSQNWSARVEYRYADFGKSSLALPANFFVANNPASVLKVSAKDSSIRVGVSYRFGGPAGPILARY
jgi:outer membrane immunogenic protein